MCPGPLPVFAARAADSRKQRVFTDFAPSRNPMDRPGRRRVGKAPASLCKRYLPRRIIIRLPSVELPISAQMDYARRRIIVNLPAAAGQPSAEVQVLVI